MVCWDDFTFTSVKCILFSFTSLGKGLPTVCLFKIRALRRDHLMHVDSKQLETVFTRDLATCVNGNGVAGMLGAQGEYLPGLS